MNIKCSSIVKSKAEYLGHDKPPVICVSSCYLSVCYVPNTVIGILQIVILIFTILLQNRSLLPFEEMKSQRGEAMCLG